MKKTKSANSAGFYDESKCWKCRRVSCLWMKQFQPVCGWIADRFDYVTDDGLIVDSYFVKDCPQFSQTEL